MAPDPASRFDPTRALGAMLVDECDVPVGMTLVEWRAQGRRTAAEARNARARSNGALRGRWFAVFGRR